MDSVFRSLLIGYPISEYPALFTDSPPVPPNERSQTRVSCYSSKMPSQFAAETNKEISQIIKQNVPEIHEEGVEVWFESLTGKALSFFI